MQALNTLRCSCTSRGFRNANTLLANTKCLQNVLPRTYCSTILDTAFIFNIKGALVTKGCFETTSQLLGCFRSSHTIVYRDSLSRTFCTVSEIRSCWKCGVPVHLTPAFFCPACKVIQAPEEHANYFDIMDCDKSFALDTQRLQKRYLHLQRSLHPDNFSRKTQKEQEYSEIQSALVNKAYKTLLKPLSRGLYMLELGGVHLEEGTDISADPGFLLEIMEINERLEETQTKEEVNGIGSSIQGRVEDLIEKINASFKKGDLQSAKVLIVEMKYFANIQEKVKERLSVMAV
ncbi:iron-sulfur cluster co-chaperone protein HscB [Megalops cyprinoides]|uniref:iron-sulfur cluster co-chaperone protein HscB n=1 Tax=Megalops cyprinoides TaxID=118141 RepID=UPI001863D19A|nr:iron-sulfur cluster co-chaperone protein HscB [Megalops cyprinoides]